MSRADERAFERVYRETYPDLRRYCARRLLTDADLVDDVLAEVYATAWRRVDDLLAADNPIGWLYGIAYRVLGNRFRSRRRSNALQHRLRDHWLQNPADPADQVIAAADLAAAAAAVSALDPVDREILLLATWEGLDYESIAQVTGLTTAAVRSRLFRTRQSLTAQLPGLFRDVRSDPDTLQERDAGPETAPDRFRRGSDGS